MKLFKVTYFREWEKYFCFVVASSEEEARKKFHNQITDREPEAISECRYGICVMGSRR